MRRKFNAKRFVNALWEIFIYCFLVYGLAFMGKAIILEVVR